MRPLRLGQAILSGTGHWHSVAASANPIADPLENCPSDARAYLIAGQFHWEYLVSVLAESLATAETCYTHPAQ